MQNAYKLTQKIVITNYDIDKSMRYRLVLKNYNAQWKLIVGNRSRFVYLNLK